jgi:hypothetical protein
MEKMSKQNIIVVGEGTLTLDQIIAVALGKTKVAAAIKVVVPL